MSAPGSSEGIRTALPRRARAAAALLVTALPFGCGGSGGGSASPITPPPDAMFVPSGSPAMMDRVRLTADAPTGDMVTLHAMIGGPTTDQDIYGFAFDLVLGDASVAEYVDGSATLGSALTLAGGQTSSVQVSQNEARVIVGVSKLGGGSGNGMPAGETPVLSLVFRLLGQGSTTLDFAGPPPVGGNPAGVPAALDSTGAVIGSVSFDSAGARLSGI